MVDTAPQLRLGPDAVWQEAPHALPVTATVQLRPVQATLPWGRIATVGFVLVVIILFAGVLISTYRADNTAVTMEGGVPLIRADRTEFRTRPEQPGGIDIPNQDRLVLQDMGRKQAPVAVAAVLPPPEQPLPRPAATMTGDRGGWRLPLPTASAGVGVVEILLPRSAQAAEPPAPVVPPIAAPTPPAAQAAAPQPELPAATAEASPPPAAPTPAAADDPIATLLAGTAGNDSGWVNPDAAAPAQAAPTQMAALSTPAAPQAQPVTAVPAGRFAVQIAAVATPEEAQAEWARFQRRFPDLFGGLQLAAPQVAPTARLGYRVQAVPLDQATAMRLCDALAAEKTGCLVVPR